MTTSHDIYLRPAHTAAAVRALAGARSPAVLAGGVDLVPRLRAGTVRPDLVVDLAGIAELHEVRQHRREDGAVAVRLGAAVTQADALATMRRLAPAAGGAAALDTMGTPLVRGQGTFVGALAAGDAAGHVAALAGAFDAVVRLAGADGERTVPAVELYRPGGRDPAELVLDVELAFPPGGNAFARAGLRQVGAHLVLVAASVVVDPGGRCTHARVGVATRGHDARSPAAARLLVGHPVDAELIEIVARHVAEEVDTADDALGSAEYRRHAVEVLTRRTLHSAARTARSRPFEPASR